MKEKEVDEELAIQMIRYAIDNGVNYIDTAYPYHNGMSEVIVGKSLQGGYREKVRIATKSPVWLVNNWEDFDRYLEEQLKKLQTDHIDYYLLHGLRRPWWDKLVRIDALGWAEKAIKDGRIGQICFSFHGDRDTYKEIVDAYDNWGFAQIQLNYLDTDYQAGLEGLLYAHSKGIPSVIMEPIKGGFLAMTPTMPIAKIWDSAEKKRTQAEWALQWLWDRPEVGIVLSGMSEMKHVIENVGYAENSGIGTLSENDHKTYIEVVNALKKIGFIACSDCRYCMPCPQGVYISKVMRLMNEYYMSGNQGMVREKAKKDLPPDREAQHCVECGQCEEKCPQELPIMRIIDEAKWVLVTPEDQE